MQPTQNIRRRTVAQGAMILIAAMALSTAVTTGALAAGHGGSHMGARFHGPIVESVPEMAAPVFNPSTPYTVPQGRETPVSPASPGSVFGNG